MKLNFLQKFNLIMFSILVVGAIAIYCISETSGRRPDSFVNPITRTDSTFAVSCPQP